MSRPKVAPEGAFSDSQDDATAVVLPLSMNNGLTLSSMGIHNPAVLFAWHLIFWQA